jgi:class 3 adenylate cyclase
MYEELQMSEGVGATLNNIGMFYDATNDHSTAIEYYRNALAIHEEVGNVIFQANTLGNIGNVYWTLGDYNSLLEYSTKALELHRSANHAYGVVGGLSAVGAAHFYLGKQEEGERYFREAIAAGLKADVKKPLANAIMGLIMVYISKERYDDAERCMDEYAYVLDAVPWERAYAVINRAILLRVKGRVDESSVILEVELEKKKNEGARLDLSQIHGELRENAKIKSDMNAYIYHNEQYQKLNDEVRGADAIRTITLKEKEREIQAERSAREIERERERAVLYSTLPKHIADRVIRGEVVNDHIDSAAVMFLDIVGFTNISSTLTSQQVITLLDSVFGICDEACAKHGVTRIKTIGDSYMAFSEIANSEQRIANAALEIIEEIQKLSFEFPEGLSPVTSSYSQLPPVTSVAVRIGLHCGPVVAGIVGKDRLQYDVWGDTVNVASRMESSSEPNRIHVSETFASTVQKATAQEATLSGNPLGTLHLTLRGEAEVKGKGTMTTYWLE